MKTLRKKIDLVFYLIVLPLTGILWSGRKIFNYLEFPPITRHVPQPMFSWPFFVILLAFSAAVILPFIFKNLRSLKAAHPFQVLDNKFPVWGWGGLALGIISWIIAWTRLPFLSSVQIFTFTPLWLSYVVVVNALTFKRTGTCLITGHPLYLLKLVLLSTFFWWYFEFLNRFVQNWYYTEIEGISPFQYFLYATLPFSTVLPAVLSTKIFLSSYPKMGAGLDSFTKLKNPFPKTTARITFIFFSAILFFIGIYPEYLYPFLWISPLFIVSSLSQLQNNHLFCKCFETGKWRNIYLFAISGLICGFFWELWNYFSFAKWIYSVPFVSRFYLFEMPFLGYIGYIPFGLECMIIIHYFLTPWSSGSLTPKEVNHKRNKILTTIKWISGTVLILSSIYFFIIPGFLIIKNLKDPAMKNGDIPRLSWKIHKSLTPKYAKWAQNRIQSGQAGNLHLYDVPSTEWPIFGSVFYLWATESLQKAHEQNPSRYKQSTLEYSKECVKACMDLIMDPIHHTWVKIHWGEDYMHTQNLFFRSLILAGATSYEKLIKDGKYIPLIKDQVESLSKELDDSPFGLINDYPNECYPIDVLAAIACIKRGAECVGIDKTDFINRSRRAFFGKLLDARGLIPYTANPETGQISYSRGIGNSHVLIFARELWPEQADEWYDLYEKHFWVDKYLVSGFREYPKSMSYHDWSFEVDAGPVISGYSTAGNAFALASSKINGRMDHFKAIFSQGLITFWPLLDGTLLGPRIVSSPSGLHAPYLGEVCILYFLSNETKTIKKEEQPGYPRFVYMGIFLYFGIGLFLTYQGVKFFKRK